MRTTTYRAPDKSRGYTGGEIAAILSRHYPGANVIARVGWKGQVQQLVVNEPDVEPYDEQAGRDSFAEYEAGCKIGPPPLPDTVQDMLTLDAIARATEAEELVREELRAEGIDVAAVERAARRAHDRGLGGTR